MTRDELKALRELAEKSTRVVSWYPHSQYDGYHPGKSCVRGPFGRWMLIEGGETKEGGPLGEGVADLLDDAKFAAAAMNNLVPLLDYIDKLLGETTRNDCALHQTYDQGCFECRRLDRETTQDDNKGDK